MEADAAADSGRLPMWAQCVKDVRDSGQAVRMVRCDAASQEEVLGALRGMEGAMPTIDCILHAGGTACSHQSFETPSALYGNLVLDHVMWSQSQ